MFARHRRAGCWVFVIAGALGSACSPDPVPADADGDTASEDTGCIPGHLDCECSDELCLVGLECIDNMCVSPECIPGYLGCECIEGLCLQGLECIAGTCSEPGGDEDPDTGDDDPDTGDDDPDTGDGDDDPDTGDGDGDPATCGDGNIDPGEACDDGNVENGDGCNDDCTESGQLLWQEVFSALENDPLLGIDDFANGVAIDSSDQIYVAGMSQINANDTNGWYRKHTPGGQLVWDHSFDGEGETFSREGCYRIAVDVGDDVVIACWYSASNTDALLRKIDAEGAEIWSAQINLFFQDYGMGVDVAPDGTIAISGRTDGMQGFVSRYNASGAHIWTKTYNTGGQGSRDVKYTANGDIAVVMHPDRHVRLYTPDGGIAWTWGKIGGQSYGLAVDGNEVLVAGGQGDAPHIGWFGRLTPTGMLASEQSWNGDTSAMANDIVLDSASNIVVTGNISVQGQGVWVSTRKYSPDGGTLIWERRLQGSVVDGFNEGIGVTVDSQDNVIVCGALAEEGNNKDAFVAKYSP